MERNQTNGKLLGFFEAEGTVDDVDTERKPIIRNGLFIAYYETMPITPNLVITFLFAAWISL